MSHLLARGVILSPLPDLEAGANRTSSHALHPDTFVGIEENWSSFFADVMRFFEATPWRSYTDTISYRPAPNAMAATIFAEHVPCGDETTIQSRFIQNVNQQLNVVCKSTNVDMVMTDYKTCVNRPVSGVPDIVALNRAGILKVVGEMKVPWMDEHNLLMGKIKKNTCWKQLLGRLSLEAFPMIILANISFRADRQIYERGGSSLRLFIKLQPDGISEAGLCQQRLAPVCERCCHAQHKE